MRSIGYLVYLLLHLLFDKITETLRWEQGKVTRDRSIEKGTFHPNSKQRACVHIAIPPDSSTVVLRLFNFSEILEKYLFFVFSIGLLKCCCKPSIICV